MAAHLDWTDIGRQVRDARLAAGMSQQDLADAVGLERSKVAKVETGARRLDALELVRFSAALRVSMDYLLRPRPLVLSHRAGLLTEDTDTEIGRESQRLDIELVTWLHEVRQLIELEVLTPKPLLLYPDRVETKADARTAAHWLRQRLGYGDQPITSLMNACERAGQFVLVTDLPGDGASLVDGGVAAAVVSVTGDPGRRRATAAHELGHLVLGDEYSSDLGLHASRQEREEVIDAFAAEFLLPIQVVQRAASAESLSREALIRLAANYRTSWTLALRQAEQAGVLTPETTRRWSISNPTKAEIQEAVGWTPLPDLESVRVPPSFATAVMTAWRRNLITNARAVELMHGQIAEADLPIRDEAEPQP